jgi:hypothetical protein
MHSANRPTDCFQVENPGVSGSSTSRNTCTGGSDQKLAAVGTATVVAIKWTNAANNGLCLSASGATVVMATCSSNSAQLFNVTVVSGQVTFTSQTTALCLTERSTGLELESCSGSSRQLYTFS